MEKKDDAAMRYRRAQGALEWQNAIEEAFKAGWDAGRVSMLDTLSEAVNAGVPQEDPEPTLWGYKVGDRVRYTKGDAGPAGAERTVLRIDAEGIALADPSSAYGPNTAIGYAIYAHDIERVPAEPQVGDLVRVKVGASGEGNYPHTFCEGSRGVLGHESGPYYIPGHRGPLSDFEKVEEN